MKYPPPYDTRLTANRLIEISGQHGEPMSIMRLLKLAYMAHGWTLAIIDAPLVNENVQAWRYGPVIPSIYYSFRPYGAYNMGPIPVVGNAEIDEETDGVLEAVCDLYKDVSTNRLTALTHIKGGPWHRTYKPNVRHLIIPNKIIAEHFKDKLRRSQNG
ncbi:MAG: DUF4065 domain-containing protein [Gammaproteobacteria bacterium]|nr:DUF4065 domain-containing protein [Gammaproteobacteria bacterium]